jgi:hypothetical protein
VRKVFILHLAGRPNKARAAHFAQVYRGRASTYSALEYADFWRFWKLFSRQKFAGIASLQACLIGIGDRHRAFLDALLFHFPYMATFTIVRQGAPKLWSQMKATEDVGDRFPDRMAHMDVREYILGRTRDGEKFVEGFYCDIFVLGVESWRHLPSLDILGRLARSGLEPFDGNKNEGFGYSALRDAYFVWLFDGCNGGEGATAAAAGASDPKPDSQKRLDSDDEDGSGLVAACDLLGQTRKFAETSYVQAQRSASAVIGATADELHVDGPVMWSYEAPGERGVDSLDSVALARIPRDAFSADSPL